MKAPESLETLVEYGIIQEVIRPLMSGKEAQVFVVNAGGEECVAKVYKEANDRTFKHRTVYTEGRRTRNTRDQRAMSKRSQHGRKKDEDAWRSTEVDMIYRLRDAGVRVPEPINFVEGVLVMELVKDRDGQAAPRLGDLTYSPSEAREIYHKLIREVVRMLCAGVIHGDLSVFNVLAAKDGPVVIDFPQAVDPTHNPNGKTLLLRDVENLHRFLARFAPDEPVLRYGEEMWSLYEKNRLRPDSKLSGRFEAPKGKVDADEVMGLIEDASRENRMRKGDFGDEDDEHEGPVRSPVVSPAPFRRVVDFTAAKPKRSAAKKGAAKARKSRPARAKGENATDAPKARGARKRGPAAGLEPEAAPREEAASPRRRRRRSRKASSGSDSAAQTATGTKSEGPRRARAAGGDDRPKRSAESKGAEQAETPRRRRRRRRTGAGAESSAKSDSTAESSKRSARPRSRPKTEPAPDEGGRPSARRRRRRSPKTSSKP